jgi:hypothetical protein
MVVFNECIEVDTVFSARKKRFAVVPPVCVRDY